MKTKNNKINFETFRLTIGFGRDIKRLTENTLAELYIALDKVFYNAFAYDIERTKDFAIIVNPCVIKVSMFDYHMIKHIAETEKNFYAEHIVKFIDELANPKSLLIQRIQKLLEQGTYTIRLRDGFSSFSDGFVLVLIGNSLYEIEEELIKKLIEENKEVERAYKNWKEAFEKYGGELLNKPSFHRRVRFELRDALSYLE